MIGYDLSYKYIPYKEMIPSCAKYYFKYNIIDYALEIIIDTIKT